MALADVYDALTSRRVYKEAFTHDVAQAIIVEESGKQFDPDVVDAFIQDADEFNAVRERLQEHHMTLELSEEAKALLAQEGFDPTYGARPLKRAIQKHLENPLAMEMLQGRFNGGDCIMASVNDGRVVFQVDGQ